MENSTLLFFINGREVQDDHSDPETTLLTYIRNKLGLKGTKLGCGEGGCGACTVMVSKWDEEIQNIKHFAVCGCLVPLVSIHNCHVTTTEGLGSTNTKVHALQERINLFNGSQCGFCIPGMIMSIYASLRNKERPESHDIGRCLQGNLCRCTGYRPIVQAFETFACDKGDECCMKMKTWAAIDEANEGCATSCENSFPPYDSSQEIIFPPKLFNLGKTARKQSLKFTGERVTWYRPTDLAEAASLKTKFPNARVVAGNTALGIEMNVDGKFFSHLICISEVAEMKVLGVDERGVTIGSSCTLTKVEEFLQTIVSKRSRDETQTYTAILGMLNLMAGTQIRNVATIGGHIMNANPISQLNPIFLVCGTKLKFYSEEFGWKEVDLDEKFFSDTRAEFVKQNQVLVSVHIPYTSEDVVIDAYKQSIRKINDGAIVTSAMKVKFKDDTSEVESFSAAFGGMDATTKVPKITVRKVVGRMWDVELIQDVCDWLQEDLALQDDDPEGRVEYRRSLVTILFFKFFHQALAVLESRGLKMNNALCLDKELNEGISNENDTVSGIQTWHEVPSSQPSHDTIGRPIPHLSGLKHTTGEAQYIGDIPAFKDEGHMVPVYSTRAYANILNVDVSEALAAKGVIAYVDRKDVPGENEINGEQVFANGKVTCVGHIIGVIIADTEQHAAVASRLVKIEYEDLHPLILTIEDAMEHKSYYGSVQKLHLGSMEEGFADSDRILEGEMRVGGQEHFYMETQTCMAIPNNEDGAMEMWSSTQHQSRVQEATAKCLGLDENKVSVHTKRMGGAYGGKSSQCCLISSPAAVAARKLGRPIRCMLSRRDDMTVTGGRHPFLARYKVGVMNDGKITALHLEMYCNGGNTEYPSLALITKTLMNCQNCYNIPNMDVLGYACRTNITSNTAMRGFGNPQALIIAETMISRVAAHLKSSKTIDEIREINLYKDGDVTHYGHKIENFLVRQCLDECMNKSDYVQAKKEIEVFNSQHRWKKRGITLIPSKYLVWAGPLTYCAQACAIVLVYTDGSVLLSHSGTEMGQGLNTKMVQVAGRALGIPLSFIYSSETSTRSIPNAINTGGSINSDLNGMAVKIACDKLLRRLETVRNADPNLTWPELVLAAFKKKINLTATGFYAMDHLNGSYDPEKGIVKGNLFSYMTHIAGAIQVEIDVLTGQHVVLRTDLVVDVGNSLNPAIDIGQIEGAFVQGYGLVTMEEKLYSKFGRLMTIGPRFYKIPTLFDVPKKFNVHLLKSPPDNKTIYSSKAVGEPAVLLGAAVFFAIRDAIGYARKDAGLDGYFSLDSPASADRIRLACGVDKINGLPI